MKKLFEELVCTYTQQGDYLLPDIKLSERSAYGASTADIVTIELLYCFAFNIKFPVCDD